MRTLLILLLSVAPLLAQNMNIQNFNAMSSGLMDLSTLTNSDYGAGTWKQPNDTDTLRITNKASVAFPVSLTVSNQTVTETGTNWLHAPHNLTNALDAITYESPGPFGGGVYYKMRIATFLRLAATNNTGSQVNYDHLMMQGNPFCVCQQQTSPGVNWLYAHGPIANGNAFEVTPGKLYWVSLFRDDNTGVCRLKVYDPDNAFALLYTSTANMGTGGSSWQAWFQANYIGNTDGYTDFGAPVITFGDDANDNDPVPTSSISAVHGRVGRIKKP